MVLFDLGRYDDARQRAGEALAHDPANHAAHTLMARTLYELDEHRSALDAATASLALQETPRAHHIAALIERARQEHASSLRHLDRAIDLEPEWFLPHTSAGLTLVNRAATEDGPDRAASLDEARVHATHGRDLAPQTPLAHYALAVVEQTSGDLVAAADHGTRCVELDPEWTDAHLLMARIRWAQGMHRLASRHLSSAGSHDRGGGRALELLKRLNRGLVGRFGRRRGATSSELVPEARRILEVDRDLRGGAS